MNIERNENHKLLFRLVQWITHSHACTSAIIWVKMSFAHNLPAYKAVLLLIPAVIVPRCDSPALSAILQTFFFFLIPPHAPHTPMLKLDTKNNEWFWAVGGATISVVANWLCGPHHKAKHWEIMLGKVFCLILVDFCLIFFFWNAEAWRDWFLIPLLLSVKVK